MKSDRLIGVQLKSCDFEAYRSRIPNVSHN